ncbi:MAG: polyribonucleotide nucleotidyltransferase [Candidatus Glassbacteria bacterium]|nr:polyribonucleotide nucleotidyltransferase [Candidatus Glassbacteria bacterium]
MIHKVEKVIGGRTLSIETGHVAKQAHGSALVRYGDTMILATVVASKEPKENCNFLPLFVDYRERSYAGGKIPGGFFKREGRPGEREILSARMIDRPIRPLFPKGYNHELMVMVTVLSSDQENQADILGSIGASCALSLSHIPLETSVAAVRMGLVDGNYLINPTYSQLEQSQLDLVVTGTRNDIIMVEGAAKELSDTKVLGALKEAHKGILEVLEMIEQITELAGVPKKQFVPQEVDRSLEDKVRSMVDDPLSEILRIPEKQQREESLEALVKKTVENLSEKYPESSAAISGLIGEIEKNKMRRMVIEQKQRIDGRKTDEIREITCEVGALPRVHGSAIFTRGQTQALVSATLGTGLDSQVVDGIEQQEYRKTFMLHYNFPSFSVGEVSIPRGPGRREIGHGVLAERAVKPIIPEDDFPYTIRLVSDILESNGSSSMATVCGSSLALMDAGVPIKKAVAGIAMGLIHEPDGTAILSDILGVEDHLGDMDFKVSGTREGLTAFQLDSKIGGISLDVLESAMKQACAGYNYILDVMDRTISSPRAAISPYAPRIVTIKIDPDKIREVIGPGGKMIRKICEESGAKIDIEDDGTVLIASVDEKACQIAVERIEEIAGDPEIGKIYNSQVKTVTSFGAFVEFMPGREGLVHISELQRERVHDIDKVVKVGDRFKVKLIGIDKQNRTKLSKIAAEMEEESS